MTELNIGKLGAVAPFKALEGAVSIDTINDVGGDIKGPKVASSLKQGDIVELGVDVSDSNKVLALTVQPLNNGVPIGIVYNKSPNWVGGVAPKQAYTQAQAISGNILREWNIETIFKKIVTLDAKTSEGITTGLYCVLSKDGVKKSASSGTTATDIIALSDQTTGNRVVVGFI